MKKIINVIIESSESDLTVEQQKQVTIEVELAVKSELLFFLNEFTK